MTNPTAAGVILRAPGGEVLFLQRGADGDHPGTWCWPGGGTEEGEDAEATARREAEEEIGFRPEGELTQIDQGGDGVDFTTFVHDVAEPFEPRLNDEHVDYLWAKPDEAPEPLHPGVETTLAGDGLDPKSVTEPDVPIAGDSLAFDRASLRRYDKDGRLHVELSNISKANICPYRGREIPEWQALGLDPERIYQMFRDPEELEKGAASFNNVPLMLVHKHQTAERPLRDQIVGSTGTDASFEAPYLRNSLVIWDAEGIEGVESEEQKELSSSYHYRADMTPGTYEGAPYDGVMRDITGNHVALVEEGRAGTDVVVGDSMKELNMTKAVLTRKALMAQGALVAYLAPKLANDAQIDVASVLKGVGQKNFKARKTPIADGLRALTKGKLAKDASLDDLTTLLDTLEATEVEGADEEPDPAPIKKPDTAEDDEPDFSSLKDKNPELYAQVVAALAGGASDEETDEDDKKKPEGASDEEDDDKDKVTPAAMDAAIAKAVKTATATAVKTQQGIRDAERAVRPYVGELELAHDSAEGVYRTALTTMGVEHKDIHASALPAILKLQPLPEAKTTKRTTLAADAKAVQSFAERFPEAARLNV